MLGTPPDSGIPNTETDASTATGRLRSYYERWRDSRLAELARFGSVGAIAYVVDIGLFNLLVHGPGSLLGHKPITAKVLAALVATVVSWLGNRYWTFTKTKTDQPTRELLAFIAVNVVTMGVSAACLWFSRYALGLTSVLADNIAANVGIVLGTALRYFAYRYLIFTHKSQRSTV
jgi:putative flippase GtrA